MAPLRRGPKANGPRAVNQRGARRRLSHQYAGAPVAANAVPISVSTGRATMALTSSAPMTTMNTSGVKGYPGTRYPSSGFERGRSRKMADRKSVV